MSTIKAVDNLREWANDRLDGYAHADAVRLADEIEAEAAEMKAFCERVEKAAKAREELEVFGTAYMPLPLDADGVPIRVGDVLKPPSDCDDYMPLQVTRLIYDGYEGEWFFDGEAGGFVGLVGKYMDVAGWTHVKPRTLEEVLISLAEDAAVNVDGVGQKWRVDEVEPYAAEIRELLGVGR